MQFQESTAYCYGWPASHASQEKMAVMNGELAFLMDVKSADVSLEFATEASSGSVMMKHSISNAHDEAFDLKKMKEKYADSTNSEIKQSTLHHNWIYSWLYIDLQEFELTNKLKYGLESKYLQKTSLPSKADRVQKIRDRLAYLQTQTPVWRLLETIAIRARWLASDIVCEYSKRQQVMTEDAKISRDKCIKEFVSEQVTQVLEKLYSQLHTEEEKLKCSNLNGDNGGRDYYKKWMHLLYPDGRLVGPLGERPLHVCALMAARYRLEGSDADGNAVQIAEGIFQGIKLFHENHSSENSSMQNELRAAYGKDYVAAVGNLLYPDRDGQENHIMNEERCMGLPFISDLKEWCIAKKISSAESRRACGVNTVEDDHSDKNHIDSMLTKGLYEGETLLFPFIASGDKIAVEWLLEVDSNEPRMTNSEANGPFFRPIFHKWLTSFHVCEGWEWYSHCRVRGNNHFASSHRSYFGFDVLSFAASQGKTSIFDLLFQRISKIWKENLCNKLQFNDEFTLYIKLMTERVDGSHAASMGDLILKETSLKFHDDEAAHENFIRRAIVNREDEFGNTMLHLAALNEKTDMFDQLMFMGADLSLANKDGLTAFTLCARLGLWKMFEHIWKKHFTNNLWRFGNVVANNVDYIQFESTSSGLMSFVSIHEIDMCVDALMLYYIETISRDQKNSFNSKEVEETRSDPNNIDGHFQYVREKMGRKVAFWCEERLGEFLRLKAAGKLSSGTSKKILRTKYSKVNRVHQMKSALRLITLFRPYDWYKHTHDKMEEIVSSKWSQGYYLIHIGDSLLPYCVLILIFGLMWAQRRIHILSHHFWWSSETVVAPRPNDGVESTCGLASIRNSYSGRLQATLIMYGVPSLLRLAMVQCRLRPSDLDENFDWEISSKEVVNFMYLNLESLLHIVTAGLFIVIGAARVSAGDECDDWYVKMEKNATAMSALGLFFNLFILCKPYKGFGLLVLTWYRFLLADVFNFLVMYGMIFVAFLIALQTLHNANISYLMWMDQTDTIFPQVQAAIGTLFPEAASLNLTYLANSNAPSSYKLLTTETVLDGCLGKKQMIIDTAFALLEISFGDGLADALEEARTKPYECAGFKSDYLTGYLLVFWVFLTNTLIMNMLIAMMNHTFDEQYEKLKEVWLLDISKRIMRYEVSFPELAPLMAKPVHVHSLYSSKYWRDRLSELCIILFCVPEVHFVVLIKQMMTAVWTKYAQRNFLVSAVGIQSGDDRELTWMKVKNIIDEFQRRDLDNASGTGHVTFWNCFWHPHAAFLDYFHGASIKAVTFGCCAEEEAKRVSLLRTSSGGQAADEAKDQGRLVSLILRLEWLKDSMQNSKLKIEHEGDKNVGGGRPDAEGGGRRSLSKAGRGSSESASAVATSS